MVFSWKNPLKYHAASRNSKDQTGILKALLLSTVSVIALSACGGGGGGSSSADDVVTNVPPSVTTIADQAISEDSSTAPLPFTITDVETPSASLTVTASSSNPTLIPDANLVLGGTGGNRTIQASPVANLNGTGTITISASDGTDTTITTFNITVTVQDDPPTAVDDGFTVNPGTLEAPLGALSNDLDPDLPADTLTIVATGTPSAGGTVTTNTGSQLLLYTPASGFSGTETFTYTIEDQAMASSTATVTVVVPNSGLIHYWKLNDASPPYADTVGSASASCATCPATTSGLIGTAQNFNGIDNELSVGTTASLNWSSDQSFGIEFWLFKSTACVGEEAVIGRSDPLTQLKWWVGCDGSGKAVFALFDENGTGRDLTATTNIADGQWHHVTAIRDSGAGQNRLYVDGKLEASASIEYPAGFISQTAELTIGWLDDNIIDYHLGGIADEVAIHIGVMSDATISQHYMDGFVGLRRGYLGCTGVDIMPLGDSNTARRGYREPLWFNLTGSSYDVDFIGGQADNCPNNPSECAHDPGHEGHSGWTSTQVASSLNTFLKANPPDVILLHVGTNDFDSGAADITGVEDILNITDTFDPSITVILARIINRKTPHQPTTEFNIALAAMAQQRIDIGDKIIIVDMESALTYPDDMEDEKHPLQVGYDKMEMVWRTDGLATFLPVCPP